MPRQIRTWQIGLRQQPSAAGCAVTALDHQTIGEEDPFRARAALLDAPAAGSTLT